MEKFLLFWTIFALPWKAWAQDERYFRQLFSGELAKKEDIEKGQKKYSYFIHTPYYALDLNHDGVMEQVAFVKKDSEDWLEILDYEKKKIFSYQFDNKGFDSELFRIEFKQLSPVTSVLLLHYYEGVSHYTEFQATARIYAVTIDNNDLTTLKGFKGAIFFDETKSFKGHYHKRSYEVYLEDLNKDSVKELVIKHNLTSTVFVYKGQGTWQTFNN